MKLFEQEEFEQAMVRAAAHFGVNEQFVEKDYYVTEILRIVADRLGIRRCSRAERACPRAGG